MIKDKYLTSAEAAVFLGFTPDHVRKMIAKGKIKAEKCGHVWLILPKNLKGVERQRFPREQ